MQVPHHSRHAYQPHLSAGETEAREVRLPEPKSHPFPNQQGTNPSIGLVPVPTTGHHPSLPHYISGNEDRKEPVNAEGRMAGCGRLEGQLVS